MLLALLFLLLQAAPEPWRPLFDGKTLTNWKAAAYPNQPEISIAGGAIVLPYGKPLTGVNLTAPFPKINYEVRFEAQRRQGNDFFSSLTFPVGDSFCTWITGGWGGDIVGLSSLDGWNANENETRTYLNFEQDRWYRFRLRVTEDRIQAWIDDDRLINVETGGRTVGLRPGDIRHSIPFGFASYNTTGAIRQIEWRPVQK